MTRKLYYEDTYLTVFEGTVLSCESTKEGHLVVLDQTAFNPEGGGQLSDQGELGGSQVKAVSIKGGIVYHLVDKALEVGCKVEGKIDFKRRFDFMQQHSGEHIISGIIKKLYGYNNVGFHLGLINMTADVDGELTKEQVEEVERLANEAIYKNIPVQAVIYENEVAKQMTYRSKIELNEDVRVVTIDGYDKCACCGTHVKNTGEIGMIKFISSDRHRCGTRLTVVCGERALKDYRMKQEIVSEAMSLLSAKPEVVIASLQKLQQELGSSKLKVAELTSALFAFKAENYKESVDPSICIEEEGLSPEELRKLCLAVMKVTHKTALVLTADGEGYKYALGNMEEDIRPLCKEMNIKFNGKGGGSKELTQGSIKGDIEEIRAFLMNQ